MKKIICKECGGIFILDENDDNPYCVICGSKLLKKNDSKNTLSFVEQMKQRQTDPELAEENAHKLGLKVLTELRQKAKSNNSRGRNSVSGCFSSYNDIYWIDEESDTLTAWYCGLYDTDYLQQFVQSALERDGFKEIKVEIRYKKLYVTKKEKTLFGYKNINIESGEKEFAIYIHVEW